MNSSKVVHVPTRDARHLNSVYDLYASRIVKIERAYVGSTYRRRSLNVGCQCNLRRDLMCTCKRLASPEPRYFSSPKQVYRYSDWRTFTDIGVGSVKALPRKRIRKIYLPETVERAVGSANLKPYINRRSRHQWVPSHYENKRTSSKCVGGFVDDDNVSLVNKQVSPIIQKKSGTTSPRCDTLRDQNINIATNDSQKRKSAISIQIINNELNPKLESKIKSDINKIKSNRTSKEILDGEVIRDQVELPTVDDKLKTAFINDNTETCKDYSSDSLVQHVHNLENPSDDKQSKMSVDPMENKLEREYRKIFTGKSKEKPSVEKAMPDFKSASLLRRRFEALRRGLGKKESNKESTIVSKIISQARMPSHKDVSIASDPPSLEGRSYSNTKIYSPYQSTVNEYKTLEKNTNKNSPKGKKNTENSQWVPELGDSKHESVQGMFKLWGKKFNLDEDNCKTSPKISNDERRIPEVLSKTESPQQAEFSKKKQGRKFFIFGKKAKDKENKPYKSKKGVTAGRCEVKDGLTIKVGGATEYSVQEPDKKHENHLEKYDNILRKAWLDKYITNTRDSRNSVHIRWNNKMYATSSSTILELMDSVYKHTGINIRSRSEITTGESSNYHSYTKQRVHFMHKDIEAWMIPKMITNTYPRQSIDYRTYYQNSNNKCRRWFVDTSKGFSQKIELVLRSKSNSKSSEYLIINIPDGYFSHSSNEMREQSSDEKIYKIIEYDTSELKKIKETHHTATGDNVLNDIKVDGAQIDDKQECKNLKTDLGYLQKTSMLRDVAIQGSNVIVPKRCDVIGVGIITQRDLRDVRKPILKIEDELSDEDSEDKRETTKKCELAESFLQNYCHNWMPSGIDMFSWHISDSQHSGNNSVTSLSQGDGTKSSPNIYDNFQESTILLSSCETSSCSHCIVLEDEKKPDDSLKSKFLSKFKKKSSEARMISDTRNCPKDSLEVHKRRQFYAGNNQKCKWFLDESPSLPSLKCKAKIADNQKLHKPCWKIPDDAKKKQQNCERHVSLPGCEEMSLITNKLSDRSLEGILNYKGFKCDKKDSNSPKCVKTPPKSVCQIPQPPCKEECENQKSPPCTKKKLPPCDDHFQPRKTPVPPCLMKPASPPPIPPICIKPEKKNPCSTCNPQRKISNNSLQRNHITKTPSGLSLNLSPSPKQSDSCFPTSPNKQEKKECKPNCANVKKLCNKLMDTPPTPPPTAYQMPQINCSEGNKDITGLHLKKMPSKKKANTRECYNSDGSDVIHLNSQEKFTIRMKKQTPSTEEIRESLDIKVQDEDGQTLFERIDYKQSGSGNKCLMLNDVYSPQIHRASTPITVEGVTTENKSKNEIHEVKSDFSIDNLIEIHFTLKLKQGDKGTEVNIKNDRDAEIKRKVEGKESQKNVYVVQNPTELEPAVGNKKDVNIKIVIKNYNNDHDKYNETGMYAAHNTDNEVFNKRISEKFHTVSTGYSDIDQNAFSVHRATVDLTASVDRFTQSKHGEGAVSKELIKIPKAKITSSRSTIERTVTDQTVSIKHRNEEEISILSLKKSSNKNDRTSTPLSLEETDKFDESKSEKFSTKESQSHIADTVDETSDDNVLYKKIRLRNRVEKKAMLKKLFRSSSLVKRPENKKRIKELIRAILTSDSSGTEIAVTSNELTKDFTYDTLDPGYFRDTDSKKKYYQLDSEPSNYEIVQQRLNPTKNNSRISDDDSDVSSQDDKKQGCMCSALATKLNISLNSGSNNRGCCCARNIMKDAEINCDCGNNDCLLDVKCCNDAETQSSKHVFNKLNSANMSVRCQTNSFVIANTSVTLKKSLEYPASMHNFSNTYIPNFSDVKYYGLQTVDRQTILGLSDDDMLVINSKMVQKSVSKFKRKKTSSHINDAAHILQLNETKKAVLEIYKEKVISDEGEKIVAKLPKFDIEKENDITNYEDVVTGRKRVSKRNFVMMTINR